jgi:hypothetical protein
MVLKMPFIFECCMPLGACINGHFCSKSLKAFARLFASRSNKPAPLLLPHASRTKVSQTIQAVWRCARVMLGLQARPTCIKTCTPRRTCGGLNFNNFIFLKFKAESRIKHPLSAIVLGTSYKCTHISVSLFL